MEVLREWAIHKSEFQFRALETIQGLNMEKGVNQVFRGTQHTFFGRANSKLPIVDPRVKRTCKICSKPHGVWAYGYFKRLDTSMGLG